MIAVDDRRRDPAPPLPVPPRQKKLRVGILKENDAFCIESILTRCAWTTQFKISAIRAKEIQ